MIDTINSLRDSRNARDIKACLDNLRLPEKVDGSHNAEFLSNRDQLKEALDRLLVDNALTTAALRKRIKKLTFALMPENEKEKIKAQAPKPNQPNKVKSLVAASSSASRGVGIKTQSAAASVTTPAVSFGKPLEEVLADLRTANSAEDIDHALTGLTEGSVTAAQTRAGSAVAVAELNTLLNKKLEAETAQGGLNAKVRRKVKRSLDVLQSFAPSVVTSSASAGSKRQRFDVPNSLELVTGGASTFPTTTFKKQQIMAAKPTTSLKTVMAAVKSAIQQSSPSDLETALGLVAVIDPEEASRTGSLATLLTGLVEKGAEGLTINSALRRRITRAVDSLKLAVTASARNGNSSPPDSDVIGTGKAGAKVTTVIVHNPKPGKDLAPMIAEVRSTKNNAGLIKALSDVSRGDGNVTTRRKLVRLLTHFIKQGSLEDSPVVLTEKTIARCLEVTKLLEPAPNSGAKLVPLEEAVELGLVPKKRPRRGREEEEEQKSLTPPPSVPHVIFLGQIPFDCSTEELQVFLQSAGLVGPVKVRMLTDESGAPKGTAFADLVSAEDMHKCLSLHHTVFKGRKINVEKSCGGKNKERRTEKLAAQKLDQESKLRAKVSQILDEYVERKVIPGVQELGSLLSDRLYTYTPAHVQNILSNVEKTLGTEEDEGGYDTHISHSSIQRLLDRTMDAFDRKLLRDSGPKVKRRRDTIIEGGVETQDMVLE